MKFYKQKILLYTFVLTLAIGITLYSQGFFENFNKLSSNLKFRTGALKLNVVDEGKWTLTNKNKSEITNKDDNNDFKNAKVGDSFIKKVVITNTGSLNQKLSIEINNNIPMVSKYFDTELISPEFIFLKPNETHNITLKMKLKAIDDKSKLQTIDLSKINTNNLIVVNAIQTSGPIDTIKLRAEQSFGVFTDSLFVNIDHGEKKFLVTAKEGIVHYNYKIEYLKFKLMDKNGNTKFYYGLRGRDNCTEAIKNLHEKSFEVGDFLEIICPRPENVLISINGGNYKIFHWTGKATYEITENSLKFIK